ncbi:MAG: hypothetical protein IJU84_07245 [Clostridia bacterium]|nr:hypothetical protein [Clostridia bacterium]
MIEFTEWTLSCFYPYVPYREEAAETNISQKCILPPIPAKVPGSVQKALLNAGLIEDPYYGMNSLKAEWIENKWWIYAAEFTLDKVTAADLVFEGIDYKAKIFLNDELCGESENMFVPLTIRAEKYIKVGKNTIKVVLEGAPDEMAQIGISELTHTQKSRFCYKWDFCTRLVHLGLNGRVFLRERKRAEAKDVMFHGNGDGRFTLSYALVSEGEEEAAVKVTLKDADDGKVVFESSRSYAVNGEKRVTLEGVARGVSPWWPNGYGEQKLYGLTLEVGDDAFTVEKTVGFKDVVAEKNPGGENSPFGYLFSVNGRRVYIKGMNVVPLDMLYSEVSRERRAEFFRLLKEANVNLVRVWGGGLIECEEFYDLADKSGIMVWQEFIQSGAGITSKPSEIPEYLENMRRTAECAVFRANHVSLTAFSGGNELSEDNVAVDFTNRNIAVLKSVTDEYCPWVLMYPTSPSGGNINLDICRKGENFDVHGPWQYYGDYHYRLFNESDSLLHSEFGCDGLNNITVFNKYLSPKNRIVTNMEKNHVWRHHGEWWDTYERDRAIFVPPETLEEQIAVSQFMQAEGLRYAIEANRRRAYNNSGSIIWQANEPYPNVSGTNVIDYFIKPKFAYYKVKQAFAKVNPNLEYDTFVQSTGERFRAKMYLTADGDCAEYKCLCEVYADSRLSESFTCSVNAGDGLSEFVREIEFIVPDCKAITVRMKAERGGDKYENDVLFPVRNGGKAALEPIIKYIKNYN